MLLFPGIWLPLLCYTNSLVSLRPLITRPYDVIARVTANVNRKCLFISVKTQVGYSEHRLKYTTGLRDRAVLLGFTGALHRSELVAMNA
jgi:hypothetical protein